MENVNEKELALKAAQYWSEFLKNPSKVVFNNGDTSKMGAMCAMMAQKGRVQVYPISVIKDFEENLTLKFLEQKVRTVHVDYDPACELAEACRETIPSDLYNSKSIFPVKTNMTIDWEHNKIMVSEGYRSEYVEL